MFEINRKMIETNEWLNNNIGRCISTNLICIIAQSQYQIKSAMYDLYDWDYLEGEQKIIYAIFNLHIFIEFVILHDFKKRCDLFRYQVIFDCSFENERERKRKENREKIKKYQIFIKRNRLAGPFAVYDNNSFCSDIHLFYAIPNIDWFIFRWI